MTALSTAREPTHFLVAGMPRGGTTFLYHHFARHPAVFLPYRKEVNYFSVQHHRGVEWYASLYADRDPDRVTGDISPPCFLDPSSIDKICSHAQAMKIILVVRDPADWAVSLYEQLRTFNRDLPTFPEFLDRGYRHSIGSAHLDISFRHPWIAKRIRTYQREFGVNLLMYRFSAFQRDPLRILNVIEDFLQLPRYFHANNVTQRKINGSHRRNLRLLSWLLSRERLIDLIGATVPRRLTMAIRARLDEFNAKPTTVRKAIECPHWHDELALAQTQLESERREIESIFGGRAVLIPDVATSPDSPPGCAGGDTGADARVPNTRRAN